VDTMAEEMERELVALAHEFAEKELRPVAAAYDQSEEYAWDVIHKAAEVGLTSYHFPEEYGGGGIESLLTQCRIHEELGWGDAGLAELITCNSFATGPLLDMGTKEQIERWIPPLCGPKPPGWALAITEPGCGSDSAAITTHAKRADGGYVMNGSKTYISNAPMADCVGVFATVAPGTRAKGITCFILEKEDEGFTKGRQIPVMGQRACPVGELFFDDCFVPEDRRVGGEGTAFRGLMRFFQVVRTKLAATSVGIGRAALEYAVEYAKERKAFGRYIHEFQAVSFRLVDARVKLDQARLMYEHAARLADAGKDFAVESSVAKIAGSEAAFTACYAAMQTLASNGYSREYPVEQWLRDAKLNEIQEGTNDILRLVVARSMFKS
jgi:alkylation response protein AidB-like acyl-CoA dehydrogenase